MDRRMALHWLLTMPLFPAVTVAAHPGQEHHAEGSFALVASAEVFLGKATGSPSAIKVGVLVEVDGIENDRGAIEAKTVRLMAR